jgi:aryl-alcohol dehydrogenase-like predicted oxidoreductase
MGVTQFKTLQNIHNVAVRSIDDPTRALCSRSAVAIVTYSPLGAGFLTGKHARGVEAGSRFDIIPGHQNVYFNETAQRRLACLKAVAARADVSVVHLALAWALHQRDVATVLIGGRTPEHIEQALRARSFHAPELFRELDAE